MKRRDFVAKNKPVPEEWIDPDEMEFSHGYTNWNELNAPTKVSQLIVEFDKDPVKAVKALFGVYPTKQQAKLIREVWKPNARVAVSSCTGAGKTTAIVWLTYLLLLCKYDCRVLVTSPSFQQLNRVFNSEALKWKAKLADVWQDMFTVTRERIVLNTKKGVQIANIVTASADNKESLQGGHSENYVILADEASAISEDVFDTLQGTLSTGIGRMILTSNPTRSSGRYYEIFHRMKEKGSKIWKTMYFSAFNCPHISSVFIAEVIETYGEDSDQYRVRVLGQFPRTSIAQFIPTDIIDASMSNNIPIESVAQFPKVCGVDVARQGDDKTIFATRQGPKIYDVVKFHGLNGPEVASRLLDYWRKHGHKAVYMDAHGVGASPYDAAMLLPGLKDVVHALDLSLKSPKPNEYFNVRAHLWGELKNWLGPSADIPEDPDAKSALVSQTFSYSGKLQYQLTSKKDMKSAGIKSPDEGDAFSYTFGDSLMSVRVARGGKRKVIKRNRGVGFSRFGR